MSNPTSTNTHRQWSRLRLKFHPHQAYPSSYRRGRLSDVLIEAQDVLQATIHKDLRQACGGFTLTLAARQEYLTNINVDDWFELYLDNGEDVKEPLMIASVDRISRRRSVDQKGATREVVSISGRDYGKVLLRTTLVIDPLLGSLIQQATFEQDVIISQYAKNDIPLRGPHEVIEELLNRYHDSRVQCLTPSSLKKHGQLVRNLHQVRGRVVISGNPNLSGNLWSTMEHFVNPVLNEMWVDTIDGAPTITLEERPFSHDGFAALESVAMQETEVVQEDIGKCADDVRNWIRIYADAQYLPAELINVAGIGFSNKFSIARSGLTKLEPTTNAFGEFNQPLVDSRQGVPSGLLQDWSTILAEWNAVNDQLFAGSLTSRLRPDARIGRRLDLSNKRTNERLSFYIESLTHNYVYPGAATTTFGLTRGVEREVGSALLFPTLKSVTQLRLEDSLQLLTDLNFETLRTAEATSLPLLPDDLA